MHELLVDLAVVTTGASLGCVVGVYLAEVLIFRKQRAKTHREIDRRVQDLLDISESGEEVFHEESGSNLNIRV